MRDEIPTGEVFLIGWGVDASGVLEYEHLQVISHLVSLECLKIFHLNGEAVDFDSHICLFNWNDNKLAVCDGSSGSPVLEMRNETFFQIAIQSKSFDDCENSIATKVSHILNWIEYELHEAV